MPVTVAIIAITCVVSFLAFNNPRLMQQLILWPPAINRGKEYWRLATCGLIHADVPHLAFNMITLYFFGRLIEQFFTPYIGALGYAAFYVGGLVVSCVPSWLRHRDDSGYRSLGASGAVSAVLFAYILLQPWALIFVFFVPVPAIIYAVLYLGYTIWADRQRRDHINHSAHLWGAVYGMLFTLAMEPRVLAVFLRQLLNPSFLS
ncbi:MAG: rhomboid family intramembrane serine protease [Lysobacteraceae bacterium]|nr:MAG: rhomboid family intramembrane serine protease [Xanthomonadaceae bacterium]